MAGGGTAPINAIPQSALCDTLEGDERTGARIVLEGSGGTSAPDRSECRPGGAALSSIRSFLLAKPNYGFDAQKEVFVEDMIAAGIVDPTKVTRSALENAASVAEMVLTTESLVADLPEPRPRCSGSGYGRHVLKLPKSRMNP